MKTPGDPGRSQEIPGDPRECMERAWERLGAWGAPGRAWGRSGVPGDVGVCSGALGVPGDA